MTLSTSGRVMELSALFVATTTFTTPSPTGPNADITSSFGKSEWNGITCSPTAAQKQKQQHAAVATEAAASRSFNSKEQQQQRPRQHGSSNNVGEAGRGVADWEAFTAC